MGCNTPKYTLVVFDMFRVLCKHNLNFFCNLNAKHGNSKTRNLYKIQGQICNLPKKGIEVIR